MKRTAAVGLLLLVGLVATGIAVAHSRPGEAREVSGDISARAQGTPTIQQCGAPDDHTFRVRSVVVGTLSSPDARLAGDVKIEITTIGDVDTGAGIARGRLAVRSPANGHLKMVGRFVAATTGLTDERFQGVIDARLTRGGGQVVANFTVEAPDENLSGEFGKDAPFTPTNKAVVSTAC